MHIAHARRVAAAIAGDGDGDGQLIAGGLLHDVLEKGTIDAEQLLALTGDPELVALVEVLTHRDGEPVEAYLAHCAADPRALRIKRADLLDKVVADDATVPDDVAESIRRQAMGRLAVLDAIAEDASR